jgi:hypothetical protein
VSETYSWDEESDMRLARNIGGSLIQMSPAGKIALAILLIQEVASEVPEKPVPVILRDMNKILLSSQEEPSHVA